ncbi:NAD(P)H-dependent oxidoreductase [Reichenbachiella agarivorans]|uniref:NAD(P)H-dependent oxidoreductase n=1 Tax=Reichenbachiella agarivorans TaxID=2979464 RepID=A0ABY6CR75_9BACT|nr:NAD(P)H-dependent oxidoreductase [Reichenbachiella agarivorans]UXP33002.1 NAD(P)H-dependent oxidoreductase [Reichenbachiella agarivorans]
MKKIVAFGASTSSTSINQKLAKWATTQLDGMEIRLLDLNDYEMPLFSVDKEKQLGIPAQAVQFKEELRSADGILISFAEHNGNFSTAFKNIFDWSSRIKEKMWLNKPMFLMATSPGQRGGQSVLDIAVKGFPHRGGQVVASFSLPSFEENFSIEQGIESENLRADFQIQLTKFQDAVS